jgi:hypothetical protein
VIRSVPYDALISHWVRIRWIIVGTVIHV